MKLLDHGHIELVESWGSDERIIEAARMSTGKGFKGWGTPEEPGDEKLLRHLWDNKHYTPFEMAGAIFEIKAPIFVFREWHRHRTQSYNEMSGRYTALPNENYIPTVERLMLQGGKNKQASSTGTKLTERDAELMRMDLERMYGLQEGLYQKFLDAGVPKELARIHLPVARYSKMRASANLRNWLHFLSLRAEAHAQWEIQQYAYSLMYLLRAIFPKTLEIARGA